MQEPDSVDISQLKRVALGLVGQTDNQQNSQRSSQGSQSRAALRRAVASVPPNQANASQEFYDQRLAMPNSPGDTQPASPWVYEKCLEDASLPQAGIEQLMRLDDLVDSQHGTQGDQIDLLGAFDPNSIPESKVDSNPHIPDDDDIDPLSQDVSAELYPESKRFQVPKTPASQGVKRKRSSQAHSQSDLYTPSLPVNPFSHRQRTGDFLDPSQMFKATQALTSPPHHLSDTPSQRPSPDSQYLQRSAIESASSPSHPIHRAAEPSLAYISLPGSHTGRREKRRSDEQRTPGGNSDGEFDSIGSDLRKRLNRKIASDQLRSAIAPPQSKPTDRKGLAQARRNFETQSSPIKAGREPREPVMISDDAVPEVLPGSITEDETERELESEKESSDEADELGEENKENIEVPRTVSRLPTVVQRFSSQPTPSHSSAAGTRRITRVPRPQRTSRPSTSPLATQRTEKPLSSQLAIADSQPSQSHNTSSPSRPRQEHGSSSDANIVIPLSQASEVPKTSSAPEDHVPAEVIPAPSPEPKSCDDPLQRLNASEKLPPPSPRSDINRRTIAENVTVGGSRQLASSKHFPTSSPLSDPLPSSALAEYRSTETRYETAKETTRSTPPLLLPSESADLDATLKSPSQRLRTIEEIAADPSPQTKFGAVDVDFGILTEDDAEFARLIPTVNERRPEFGRSKEVASSMPAPIEGEISPSRWKATPRSPPSSAYSVLTPASALSSQEALTAASQGSNAGRGEDVLGNPDGQTFPIPVKELEKIKSPTRVMRPHDQAEGAPRKNLQSIIALNRVFAYFNGSTPAYFPATCKTVDTKESRYEVIFDDGASSVVQSFNIRRLELRKGDVCKVDMPGARPKNYIVDEVFKDDGKTKHESESDIFGNTKVTLYQKQRTSDIGQEPVSSITVSVTNIYFTTTQLFALRDREYTYEEPNIQAAASRLQTPCESMSNISPPTSKSRRLASSRHYTSRVVNGLSVDKGLFHSFSIAFTNIGKFEELEDVKRMVGENGGFILEDGFDVLFDVADASSSQTADPSRGIIPRPSPREDNIPVLIADRHCRTAKYVQALALGIPCLARRWVSDCVTKQTLLPLSAYLLAAGESSFLDGAVHSRVLPTIPDPRESSLQSTIAQRSLMLSGTSCILLIRKNEEHKMKHYKFLTHALGAIRTEKVTSVEAMIQLLKERRGAKWDWIFTYDKREAVEEALDEVQPGRKKKKGGSSRDSDRLGALRVADNEFVMQSLILGQLVDI